MQSCCLNVATAVVWGCLKKKMLVLEGGVELPVLHENGHTDVWSTMVKNKKKNKKNYEGKRWI